MTDVQTSTTMLLNYGAVGAMLVLCVVALVYMVKFFMKQSEKNNARYDAQIMELSNRLNKYIEEDRKKMMDVIANNTEAFIELKNEIHLIKSK